MPDLQHLVLSSSDTRDGINPVPPSLDMAAVAETKQPPAEGKSSNSRNTSGSRAATRPKSTKTPPCHPVGPDVKATSDNSASFEGALTRLAAAASLGTEQLIYVRRADVEELVDALLREAVSPGGTVSVASPTLERLTIVRHLTKMEACRGVKSRSRASIGGAMVRRGVEAPRSRCESWADGEKLFITVDDDDRHNERRARRSRSPRSACRTPPPRRPATCLKIPSNTDSRVSFARAADDYPADASDAATHTRRGSVTAQHPRPPPSPVPGRAVMDDTHDTPVRRRRSGCYEGQLSRYRHASSPHRSAPPPSPSGAPTTPRAFSSPVRAGRRWASTSGGGASTLPASPSLAKAPSRSNIYTAGTAAAATAPATDASASASSGESETRSEGSDKSSLSSAVRSPAALSRAESRRKVYAAAAAAAAAASSAKPAGNSAAESSRPSLTLSPAACEAKKVNLVPTPRAADSVGSGAFDDFWSSGLQD